MTGPVLPGLAEAIAAQVPGLYVDQPQPEVLEEDLEDAAVPDVCDICNGTGWLDCETDSCSRCARCGGAGYLP